jgi:hypothetical protein
MGRADPTLKRGANEHCAYGAIAPAFAKLRGRREERESGKFDAIICFALASEGQRLGVKSG